MSPSTPNTNGNGGNMRNANAEQPTARLSSQRTAELQEPRWAKCTASLLQMYSVVRAGSRKVLELDDLPDAPNPAAAGERFMEKWE